MNTFARNARIEAPELSSWLKQHVANMACLEPEDINENTDLTDYGLDSSALLTLTGDLEDYLEIEIDPTVFYETPTIAAIVTLCLAKTNSKVAA